MKIEDLKLSPRSYNALKRSGFDTVEQVLELTPHQLLLFRSIGDKVKEEIYSKIQEAGYALPY